MLLWWRNLLLIVIWGNYIRKAEQHYSEQQSPSSQPPLHLMMARENNDRILTNVAHRQQKAEHKVSSKVMLAHTNHGKTISETRNSSWKSRVIKIDHLEDHGSTKSVQSELHKSKIHSRTAIAKPPITESNAQIRKWRCHNHKTRTSDKWKCVNDMVRWVILHAVPYIRKSLCLENTKESLQFGMTCSTSETWWGVSVVGWAT
jgi:hypothetical protein